MSTIVRHTIDHRGMQTSRCPRCSTMFIAWDDDDLDDNGDLLCYCDEEDARPVEPCVRCGKDLTPADPAVTILGPRCASCWADRPTGMVDRALAWD